MSYLLGIDQGGTKTAAILCNSQGRILGSALSPGLVTTYFQDVDEIYIKNIRTAAEEVCTQAGIALRDITSVCGCLNGADWDFEYTILKERLIQAVGCPDTLVLNDCIGAMRGGTDAKEWAVICAGSGLNIAVRCIDGREIIYGYFIASEDQGGSALGQAVLRKTMDAYLGLCTPTQLTELILAYTGYTSAEDLMIDLSMEKFDLQTKELTRCLLQAYLNGDKEASEVVDIFAKSISRYVIAGMKKFHMMDRQVPIVFSGSVFKDSGTLISKSIFSYIQEAVPKVIAIDARYEPVCGATLTLLDKQYQGKLPSSVMEDFDQSASKWGLLRDIQISKQK